MVLKSYSGVKKKKKKEKNTNYLKEREKEREERKRSHSYDTFTYPLLSIKRNDSLLLRKQVNFSVQVMKFSLMKCILDNLLLKQRKLFHA